ncbi:MAG: EAL domain-containing protein, partial [Pseudomonadota bacterium]
KALETGGVRWLTFLFDVTVETRTEALFQRVTQQLDFVSNAIPDGFALFDPREKLVVCNAMFRKAYGLPKWEDLRGMCYHDILIHAVQTVRFAEAEGRQEDWIADALACFRAAQSRSEQQWDNGRWMRVIDRPTGDGGRVTFRIEITEAMKRKQELEQAAATDPVTGLLNRRGLAVHVRNMQAACPADHQIVFFHIDLDRFKAINDVHGHDTGDLVLVETSRRLRAHLDGAGCVARVGGDEFVAVKLCALPDPALIGFAETLRTSIIDPINCLGRLCQIGATLGLAAWQPGDTATVEQTLIDADTALMAGKAAGRNKTVRFSPEMRAAALNSASLAAEIKAGIAQNAFEPFFQPQMAYPGGEIVGLEALARWRRDDGSYVPAGSFIELATETGLITEIDRMILDRSLDLLADLKQAGLGEPSVSINFSAMQLGRDTVVENLLDTLFVRGISPSQINIEVLETTLLDSRADKIGTNIKALAEAGFSIELDDFGTGHTALASLTTFPVHRIKVDRSLIEKIDTDRKKRAVVSGLFLVCVKLGIEALAEGVETSAELRVLREIGFRRFQGYYFAKPLAAADVPGWVREWQEAV